MRLKRYAVTLTDNWTPMRTFWTWTGACEFAQEHGEYSHLYVWRDGAWQKPKL